MASKEFFSENENRTTRSYLMSKVHELEHFVGSSSSYSFIKCLLCNILEPLFENDGFQFNKFIDPECGYSCITGRAILDTNKAYSFLLEYDHCIAETPTGVGDVERFIENRESNKVDRLIVVSRLGYTAAARILETFEGGSLQLFDLKSLENWIHRLTGCESSANIQMNLIISRLSHDLACKIAADSKFLDYLEWRDFERMIARVMEGLGFSVRLTSASKDGGKDLVLGWEVQNIGHSYIVELKHWRSNKRVGPAIVNDFVRIVTQEKRDGGLILSSSGFSNTKLFSLTESYQTEILLGGPQKIHSLVRNYVRAESGLWSPPKDYYHDLLTDRTLRFGFNE